MKLLPRLLIAILPVVIVSVFGLGLWSFFQAKAGVYGATYEKMEQALAFEVSEHLSRRHTILQRSRIEGVAMFLHRFQQEAIAAFDTLRNNGTTYSGYDAQSGRIIFPPQAASTFADYGEDKVATRPAAGKFWRGTKRFKGKEFLYVATFFEPWDWIIVYEVDSAVAVNSVRHILIATLLFSAFCAALLIGAIAFVLRYVVEDRLAHLSYAAERLAKFEPVEIRGAEMRDEIGELTRSFKAMAEDIQSYNSKQLSLRQDLEASNRRLEESDARLLSIMEATGDAIAYFDRSDQLTYYNTGFRHFHRELGELLETGLSFPELARACASNLARADKSVDVEEYVKTRIAQHYNPGATIERTRPDGSAYITRETQMPDGGVIIVTTDVTQLKRREVDLQRSNRELEQFAYVASHDLQEPLRIIRGYTQLLKRQYHDQFDQDGADYLNYAADAAERMQMLVSDLLKLSRVTAQQKSFQLVSVEEALQNALMQLKSSVEETHTEISHSMLPVIRGDSTQLTQLFQNLVGNAIKYRSKRAPRISVEAELAKPNWIVTVRDNGLGIEPRFHDRIFEVFERLHNMEHYSGTGIGLAICRKIVERHNGRIWVESNSEEGTAFKFTLPMVADHNATDTTTSIAWEEFADHEQTV